MLAMSGYQPGNERLYRLWNISLVLPVLLAALPIMALIALLLAVTQGPRNVFYRGERIGKDGKLFHILKFKTLRDAAAAATRDRVLPTNSNLETPLGGPLRETRLDELPQLINVLRGDMNMLGPRPVRPAIAETCRHTIPGYDRRFEVRPGLIGYTQALMPHGANKAIRARINAMLCRRPVSLVQEVMFVTLTGLSVLAWTLRVAVREFLMLLRLHGGIQAPPHGEARIEGPSGSFTMKVAHIDGTALLLEAPQPLPVGIGPHSVVLRRDRGKTARCDAMVMGTEVSTRLGGSGRVPVYRYRMRYQPASYFQKYLIDRYFVGAVLVR
jgi:lipopolysaccharide/colanic/teichoic acid biosynthesis glycosyltransferase